MGHSRTRGALFALIAVLAIVPAGGGAGAAEAPTITTVAGTIPSGVPGPNVSLKPTALAFAPDGDLYIADAGQGIVWRQEPDGTLHHFAGTGRLCLPDPERCRRDGGPAVDTFLKTPAGIAVGPDGDVYVAERRAHRIRRIDAQTRTISTFAGNGEYGYSPEHEGVPAVAASLAYPESLDFDSKGNLYIADIVNRRIRRVTPEGTITTVAGCGRQSWPECFHYARDGSPIFSTPIGFNAGINGNGWGMAVSPTDELYIGDAGMVLRADLDEEAYQIIVGEGFKYASSPGEGEGGRARDARMQTSTAMTFGDDGTLYMLEGGGLAVSPWNRIQKVEAPATPDSIIRHVGGIGTGDDYAGDGGDARKARFAFAQPHGTWTGTGVAVNSAGDVFVADVGNERVRRIDAATNVVTTWAGNGHGGAQYIGPSSGDFQPIGAMTQGLTSRGGLSGDGGPAAQAQLYQPFDVEIDHLGNVYFLDRHSARVRRIDKYGTITTVVGSGCVGERCSRYAEPGTPVRDGVPAAEATLLRASGIALDRTGTQLYIADDGQARVRQVNLGTKPFTVYPLSANPITIAPGHIATVFGEGIGLKIPGAPFVRNYYGCALLKPYCGEGLPAEHHSSHTLGDVVTDAKGNLYVADSYANQVWKVDAITSQVTTVVGVEGKSNCTGAAQNGEPGRVTQLCSPTSLTIGPDGALYVAETGGIMGYGESLRYGWINSGSQSATRIRKVDLADPLHRSTVIAGTTIGFGGDGGPATKAQLAWPHGLAVAKDGTVYVADTGNHRVRKIAPDGTISTVAGQGAYYPLGNFEYSVAGDHEGCDFSGDGGAASEAELCAPIGLALDRDGTLYVTDAINNRLRVITGL